MSGNSAWRCAAAIRESQSSFELNKRLSSARAASSRRGRAQSSSSFCSALVAPDVVAVNCIARSLIYFQYCEKRFLGNLDAADFLHALLAFLLLLEQLPLARDVTAVAFGDYVLAHRLHRFARDYFGADGRLDGHFKKLPRDQFLHFGGQGPAFGGCGLAMQNQRESIDRFA